MSIVSFNSYFTNVFFLNFLFDVFRCDLGEKDKNKLEIHTISDDSSSNGTKRKSFARSTKPWRYNNICKIKMLYSLCIIYKTFFSCIYKLFLFYKCF